MRRVADDAALLHRIETAGHFQPPDGPRAPWPRWTPAESASAGWRWPPAWTDLSRSCGDLRFLNAACKLTGAVWLHHQRTRGDSLAESGVWRAPGLTRSTRRCRAACLTVPPINYGVAWHTGFSSTGSPSPEGRHSRTVRITGQSRVRGSLCWPAPGLAAPAVWLQRLPLQGCPLQPCAGTPRHLPAQRCHRTTPAPGTRPQRPTSHQPPPCAGRRPAYQCRHHWDEVKAAIRAANTDLVLLVEHLSGRPRPRTGGCEDSASLNAHNGAPLPSHTQHGRSRLGTAPQSAHRVQPCTSPAP